VFVVRVHLQEIQVVFGYEGHRVKVKVSTAKTLNVLFPRCKTLLGNKFGSIEDRVVKFAPIPVIFHRLQRIDIYTK